MCYALPRTGCPTTGPRRRCSRPPFPFSEVEDSKRARCKWSPQRTDCHGKDVTRGIGVPACMLEEVISDVPACNGDPAQDCRRREVDGKASRKRGVPAILLGLAIYEDR